MPFRKKDIESFLKDNPNFLRGIDRAKHVSKVKIQGFTLFSLGDSPGKS